MNTTTSRFPRTSSSSSLHTSLKPKISSSSNSLSSLQCVKRTGTPGEKCALGNRDSSARKFHVKASVASENVLVKTKEAGMKRGGALVDVATLVRDVKDVAIKILRSMVRHRIYKRQAEAAIEKAVIDCRFFTLFAVAGSLLGSILCFVEGCFLILESYFHYFQTMVKHASDHEGHVVQLVIEAIDMFLLGGALLMFGMGIYAMFVRARNLKTQNGSNLSGLFPGKVLPVWLDMQCVSQAKTRIGHAIIMILQVGVMEKVKNIPFVSAVDLACFGGTVLVSSLTIFVLSRLSTIGNEVAH